MSVTSTFAINPGMAILLKDLGLSAGNLLRRASLPENLLSQGSARLSPEAFYRLWDAIEAEAGTADLPVLIGRAISVEVFDPPIFAALCSPDLNTAAERIARYKKLCGPLRLVIRRSETETSIQCIMPSHPPAPAGLQATELIFWVALARLATRADIQPVRLTLPALPAASPAYADYLGADIQRGTATTVVFSAADAARPLLTANTRMWDFFEPELRRRLAELEAGATLTEQVHSVLLELLPAGAASIESVSRKIGVSSRTLQRRLKGEQTTFQRVLSQTRESLARHYLKSSAISSAEISFLLGYEDPNSFYRAFHAWTGTTPESVRAAV